MTKGKRDQRKEEILEATRQLIAEKGLKNTSTTDIAERAKMARGTLYHYFSSREEIIDALVQETTEELFTKARQVADDLQLSIPEKLLAISQAMNVSSESGMELRDHINQEDNLVLHHKVEVLTLTHAPAIFSQVIEEGIRQGIFQTDYPLEAMELLTSYVIHVIDNDALNLTVAEKTQRIKALLTHFERVLACDEGYLLDLLDFLPTSSEERS